MCVTDFRCRLNEHVWVVILEVRKSAVWKSADRRLCEKQTLTLTSGMKPKLFKTLYFTHQNISLNLHYLLAVNFSQQLNCGFIVYHDAGEPTCRGGGGRGATSTNSAPRTVTKASSLTANSLMKVSISD